MAPNMWPCAPTWLSAIRPGCDPIYIGIYNLSCSYDHNNMASNMGLGSRRMIKVPPKLKYFVDVSKTPSKCFNSEIFFQLHRRPHMPRVGRHVLRMHI